MTRRTGRPSVGRAPRALAASVGALALGLLGPVALAAQGGEGEAGGPGLVSVNLALSLWTVVVFLALLAVLRKFAFGPILGAAAAREKRIQDALDEAAKRQAEAARLLEEHKAQLADARRQAQEIIGEGRAAGERVRKEIEAKAREEAGAILERARKDIGREKEEALAELRRYSVEIALAAATKLLGEKLDSDRDRELVLGWVEELGREGSGEGARA